MIPLDCAIVGTGAAALIAADQLCAAGLNVALFERKPSPGWKLLVAGSSGLNISYDAPLEEFITHYTARQNEMATCLRAFPPTHWIEYVKNLGEEPYVGTSRRYFVRSKTAANLLQSWIARLKNQGAQFFFEQEMSAFTANKTGYELQFSSGKKIQTKTILFALGGASWENQIPGWSKILSQAGLEIKKFAPANAGYHLQAPVDFFTAAEGKPIKGLTLKTAKGEKQGELMITKYGLEGTPVYTMGCPGEAFLDLKPDLALEKLIARMSGAKGDIKNKIIQAAKLSDGALQLLWHLAPKDFYESAAVAASYLKNFPITLTKARDLSESISSSGGLSWDELNQHLELKKYPGIFCAGEMVDWDAPTGGFLIQGSVSMGMVAAKGILSSVL